MKRSDVKPGQVVWKKEPFHPMDNSMRPRRGVITTSENGELIIGSGGQYKTFVVFDDLPQKIQQVSINVIHLPEKL